MGSWTAKKYARDLLLISGLGYGGWYLYQLNAGRPADAALNCREARRRLIEKCRANCESGDGHVSAVRKLENTTEDSKCVQNCGDDQVNLGLPDCAHNKERSRRRK
jgi:hypothetical protein